jgi:coproporphyrinogen III oxidase-like Fe-S oxidoreductase
VVAGAAARGSRSRVTAFVAALRRELDLRADALDATWGGVRSGARAPLDSLYLGGGTPSLLPAEVVAGLIELVRSRYGLADGAEVTLEANPGPDERGDAAALAAAGVTRISVGAQVLRDGMLRSIGRRHRTRDVEDAVAEARAAGIASVNIDLLYDLPGDSLDGWIATLEAGLALAPDHLSLYSLTLDDPDAEGLTGPDGDHLPTTRGARRWRAVARTIQDEDRAAAMYHHAVYRLAEAGYEGYEISNWARPGHESRHNLLYWERRPYEAAGPGAHAFDGATRRWNAARLDAYVAALTPPDGANGGLPPGGTEVIDDLTAASEAAILGLRTSRGLPASAAAEPPLAEHFGWALGAGLLSEAEDGRIVLTTRGRLLSNELFSRLV